MKTPNTELAMNRILKAALMLAILNVTPIFAPAGELNTKLAFTGKPLQAIEQLKDLEKLTGKTIAIHDDEVKLLTEAAQKKLASFSASEAAIIASGVVASEERSNYLKKLDGIEKDARQALSGIESNSEKANKLLQFLHRGPMAKGYILEQTDLTGILDTGHFNCVSSAVLFNIIATRLGLDVAAYEISGGAYGTGHVFSVLLDGDKQIPVETTNAKGFNVQDNMKKSKKRKLSDLGLIAVIYYNHGVALGKAKQYHAAVVANLRALSLDRENASAANNVMADLTNWGVELSHQENHADALEVLRVSLTIAPGDSKLVQNRKAIVQQIVMKEVKAGNFDAALSRLTEHKTLLADKNLERGLALNIVDTHAKKYLDNKGWAKAIEVYVDALKSQPKDGHLTNNLVATIDSWAQESIQRSDWTAAIQIYEQGLKHLPGNGHLENNLRYCQEQMKSR